MKLGSTGMSTSHWCAPIIARLVCAWYYKEGRVMHMGQHGVHVHTRFKVGFYSTHGIDTKSKIKVTVQCTPLAEPCVDT